MINKNDKILVTGGTGFVGSYVLRYLIKKGYQNVISLRRANSRTELLADVSDKIRFHEADLSDITALEDIIKEVDIVIHVAAVVSFRNRDKDKMMKVNVEGTTNIVNICLDNNIKKFIYVSSIAALGRSTSGKVKNEKAEWENSKNNSDYAISKYLAEMEVWRAYAEGLPVAVINPSLILGAGFWNIGSGELFNTFYKGLKFYPVGSNGFVDVRDVAQMIIKLMESDIVGERIICSSENLKMQSLFTQISINLGKKSPSIKLTPFLVKISSFVLDFVNLIPGYSSNLSSQSLRNASFDSLYDNTKSKELLNYQYIPIQQTVEEASKLYLSSKEKGLDYAVFGV